MNSNYQFLKFKDGWWSVIFYVSLDSWGKWRGPFDTKAEAKIDCVNASRNRYILEE